MYLAVVINSSDVEQVDSLLEMYPIEIYENKLSSLTSYYNYKLYLHTFVFSIKFIIALKAVYSFVY